MNRSVVLCVLIVSLAVPAAAFDGAVTSRRISVKPSAIAKLVGGDKKNADRVLSIPADKLLEEKEGVDSKTSTVLISGPKVRVETTEGSFVLMDAESGTLQIVNAKEHKVMEMTRSEIKSAAEKIAGVPANIQEQIDKLPPDKRKQVEAAMKSLSKPVNATPGAGPTLRALEKSETINGYKCSAFESKNDGETSIGWITQDAKDLASAFRAFAAAEQSIRPGPKNARMLMAEKGLPMRMQTLTDGGYQLDEIVKIEPKAIPADQFKVPPGYVKTDAQGMFGGAKR